MSCKVGARVPHTLHLKVRGSLDLRIVIVMVLNTPLLGFSSAGSIAALSSWVLV